MNLSIVVPLYNEVENLREFCLRLLDTLIPLKNKFEVIFVNDGSTDNSLEFVTELAENDERFKVINLSRKFGKEIALSAGLDFSTGEAVIVLEADLRDPPELIPELIEKWQEGFDVVYAIRKSRSSREPLFKKLLSFCYFRLMKKISKTKIPLDTGYYRLMSRQAVYALSQIREHHRFLKGLFSCIGFKQTGVNYHREQKPGNKNEFKFSKLWELALDGITSFSFAPMQFALSLGITVTLLSILAAAYLFFNSLFGSNSLPAMLSLLTAICFFSGIQLIFTGIIGEYIGRTHIESKQRPLYFIKELVGFKANKENLSDEIAKGARFF